VADILLLSDAPAFYLSFDKARGMPLNLLRIFNNNGLSMLPEDC